MNPITNYFQVKNTRNNEPPLIRRAQNSINSFGKVNAVAAVGYIASGTMAPLTGGLSLFAIPLTGICAAAANAWVGNRKSAYIHTIVTMISTGLLAPLASACLANTQGAGASKPPLQDRNSLVCNPATFFDPGLQEFQGESFVDKIHSISLKNLTPIPLHTDSGALWLQDSEKNPMGIFKYGNGQEADHIVHQIVNTSGGLLKTPSIFKTSWINDNGYSIPGNLLEYVPHLEGEGYFMYSSHNFAKFEKVSTESLQSKAFLDLLIDNRDSHMGNVMVSPNYEVITIDHDHSLLNDNFQDIAELIRKNESFTSRSGVSNVPFWMQRQLADRIKSPISTKLACWIESLDLEKCCNKVEKKVWIHLNARLTFIKIALRNGRHLTDLYDYLTSRRYEVEGTIYQDYVKAMRLTAESFHDLQNTSDDDLYATFLHHFLELATIRVAA